MGLIFEHFYPFIGGVIAFFLWQYLPMAFPSDSYKELLSSSLTVGAILTGFLTTSKTILISLHGTKVIKRIRETGYISDLIRYLAQAIWICFSFCIITLAGFFLGKTPYYGPIWFASSIIACLAFYRVTNIFIQILHYPDDSSPNYINRAISSNVLSA